MPSPAGRAVVVLLLLAGLAGLCVWYGSLPPDPGVGAYPDGGDLREDYDRYVGAEVSVVGYVVETDPVVVDTDREGPGGRLAVTGLGFTPEPADNLWVFGVAERGNTVRATTAFAVPRTGVHYTLGISFLAGLWTLSRLVQGWRLGPGWTLVRREEPLGLGALLRGGDDA